MKCAHLRSTYLFTSMSGRVVATKRFLISLKQMDQANSFTTLTLKTCSIGGSGSSNKSQSPENCHTNLCKHWFCRKGEAHDVNNFRHKSKYKIILWIDAVSLTILEKIVAKLCPI